MEEKLQLRNIPNGNQSPSITELKDLMGNSTIALFIGVLIAFTGDKPINLLPHNIENSSPKLHADNAVQVPLPNFSKSNSLIGSTAYVILDAIDLSGKNGGILMAKKDLYRTYAVTIGVLLAISLTCGISLLGLNFIPYIIAYIGFTIGGVGSIGFIVDLLKRVNQIGEK